MEDALVGAVVGGLVGAIAGFLAAIAIQLGKGLRNRIMARRGAGQFKDMVFPRLHLPAAILGALVGAAIAPFWGLWWAAAGAAAPPLLLALVAIPATLWVACTIAVIDETQGPPGGA